MLEWSSEDLQREFGGMVTEDQQLKRAEKTNNTASMQFKLELADHKSTREFLETKKEIGKLKNEFKRVISLVSYFIFYVTSSA